MLQMSKIHYELCFTLALNERRERRKIKKIEKSWWERWTLHEFHSLDSRFVEKARGEVWSVGGRKSFLFFHFSFSLKLRLLMFIINTALIKSAMSAWLTYRMKNDTMGCVIPSVIFWLYQLFWFVSESHENTTILKVNERFLFD